MKKTLLTLLAVAAFMGILGLTAYPVVASTLGPNSPGTTVDDATVGTLAWTNPNNAQVSDGVFATAVQAAVVTTHYLKATNFSFSVPARATINGITVGVQRKASSVGTAHVRDGTVKLVLSSGSFGSVSKADTATNWPTTEATMSYGSSSDLWTETLTPADINSSNFGAGISAVVSGVGGPSCLSADTLINTPSGKIRISDLKSGDPVYSYNDKTEEIESDTVVWAADEPISLNMDHYDVISTSDGNIIRATDGHPFYVNGAWIEAKDLEVGQELLSSGLHKTRITAISQEPNTTDHVWNIEVKKNHNFFANDVLVHNATTETASIDYISITVTYSLGSAIVTIGKSRVIVGKSNILIQ